MSYLNIPDNLTISNVTYNSNTFRNRNIGLYAIFDAFKSNSNCIFDLHLQDFYNNNLILYVKHNNGYIDCNAVIINDTYNKEVNMDYIIQKLFEKFKHTKYKVINFKNKIDLIINQLNLKYDDVGLFVNKYNQIMMFVSNKNILQYRSVINLKKVYDSKEFTENFKEKIIHLQEFYNNHISIVNNLNTLEHWNNRSRKLSITDIMNYNKMNNWITPTFLDSVLNFSSSDEFSKFNNLIETEKNSSIVKKYILSIRCSKLIYYKNISYEMPIFSQYIYNDTIMRIMYFLWVKKFKKLNEIYSFVDQCRLESLILK